MDTAEVKSVDYNTQKVLVSGGVEGFYGFRFIRLEDAADGALLPKSGSTRSCFAWGEIRCAAGARPGHHRQDRPDPGQELRGAGLRLHGISGRPGCRKKKWSRSTAWSLDFRRPSARGERDPTSCREDGR